MADELVDPNKPIEPTVWRDVVTWKDVVRQPKRRLSRKHRKAWAEKIHAEAGQAWREKKAKDKRIAAENSAADQHLKAAGIVFKKTT